MKRYLMAVGILILALSSLSVNTSAQSNPCVHFGTGFVPPFPPGFISCEYITFTYAYTCAFYSCPPADAAGEILYTCPNCSVGRPIDLLTGDTSIEENDITIPGLSRGLTLTRTWNSLWPPTQAGSLVGIFGPNWRSTYEERIFIGSDDYTKYARSDGNFWSFAGSYALYPVAPANVTASLTVDSGYTQWTLAFQNGEKRIFSYASGSLIAIVDRNGNTTQLSYNAVNQLTTVTDPVGRHLYFNYGSGTLSNLVTSVTSDVGISLSYRYDTYGRLIQVTEPDQTTISYQYNSNSMITSVLDSAGNLLESHTYDSCNRGLTSSRDGGVESATVSYNQPCWSSQPVNYGIP